MGNIGVIMHEQDNMQIYIGDKPVNVGKTYTLSAEITGGQEEIKKLFEDGDKLYKQKLKEADDICEKHVMGFVDANEKDFKALIEADEETGKGIISQLTNLFRYAFRQGWNECYTFHKDILER